MKKIVLSIALVLGAVSFSNAQLQNFSVGETAPDFTVTDLHGEQHTLTEYAGKWVMIDFFAYWCGPCAQIAPIVNEFYRKYGCNNYDVVVLGLEYEGTTAQTQAFEDANGGGTANPTPTVSGLDGGAGAVHASYGPAAYPTIILIGPDGKIKNIDIWPIGSVASIESAFTNAGATSALVVNSCALATDDLALESANVYPNPTSGDASIQLTVANAGDVSYSIYAVTGELLSTHSSTLSGGQHEITIPMAQLKAGSYFVTFTKDSQTKTVSVIKL